MAHGRAADLYDLGDGRVLRRYRTAHCSAPEATVIGRLLDAGNPVPKVLGVDGGDIIMGRINGPTMLEALARKPWRLLWEADRLAGLHGSLHRITLPEGRIVHLDLPSRKRDSSKNGPVVIDWGNAEAGVPELHIANTWLIMSTPESGATASLSLRLLQMGRGPFLHRFLGASA